MFFIGSTHLSTVTGSVNPLRTKALPNGSGPYSRTVGLYTQQKLLRDPDPIKHPWAVLKQVWSMEDPPRNPQNSKSNNYTGARCHRAFSEVLCPWLNGSEPSLIQSEAAVDKTCYSLSHGCSIKLRSWEFGDQFDALSSLSHSWAVLQCDRLHCPALGPMPSGRAIDIRGYTSSATLFGCVVGVKEYFHECQYTRFPSRTLHH